MWMSPMTTASWVFWRSTRTRVYQWSYSQYYRVILVPRFNLNKCWLATLWLWRPWCATRRSPVASSPAPAHLWYVIGFFPWPSSQELILGMQILLPTQPPRKPLEQTAKYGRPKNDEDPGIHNGIDREKTESCKICCLICIGGKGSNVSSDL